MDSWLVSGQGMSYSIVPLHSIDQYLSGSDPVLVFDGGCPFCAYFALASELRSGISNLVIADGRLNHDLRLALAARGYYLVNGAMLLAGGQILHGSAAIQWICQRMNTSDPLLKLLSTLLARPQRADNLYPLLMLARRLALALKRLPVDPDNFDH